MTKKTASAPILPEKRVFLVVESVMCRGRSKETALSSGRGIGVESLPQRQAKKGGIARHRRGRRSRTHPCCRHRRRALRGRGPAHSSVPAGQLYPLRVSWQTAASLDASLSSCPLPLLARSCGKTKIQAASERLIERSKFRTFRRIFSIFVSTSKQTGCGGRGRLARKVSRRAETRTKVKSYELPFSGQDRAPGE